MSSSRVKWGDVDESDDQPSLSGQSRAPANVPQGVVSETVDKNTGIRTVVEYTTNTEGKTVKITKRIKSTTKSVQVNKNVLSRRKWAKFGECRNAPAGIEQNVTIQSNELITLDLTTKKERTEQSEESALDKLKGGSSIVVCSYCKEPGHFSLKCPKRSQLAPRDPTKFGTDTGSGDTGVDSSATAGATGSRYVPMHMRNPGAAGAGDKGRDNRTDEPTLRVTNLSEDVTEADLHELFRRFGRTSRIYLAKDRITNLSRGFAFVNFDNRSDAQAAIDKLNGHGYDNLILHVEWAKAKE